MPDTFKRATCQCTHTCCTHHETSATNDNSEPCTRPAFYEVLTHTSEVLCAICTVNLLYHGIARDPMPYPHGSR